MSRLSQSDRTLSNLFPFLVATLAFIILVASPVMAQFTQEDIDKLRERGKQEGWTFEVGLCEINSKYPLEQVCGMVEPPDADQMAPKATLMSTSMAPPATWDWRDLDGVTPVKNQANCGSCWAFATCAAVESAIKIMDGITVDLSEQWLNSCNTSGWGCGGGWYAYNYFVVGGLLDDCGDNGGVLEPYFPYTATDAPCNCPYPHEYWIDGWSYVYSSNQVAPVDDIKQAIMEWGPVAVGVYVNDAWYGYAGGIFNDCQNFSVNHTVLVVGWDDNYEGSGQGVWIIKNSWGTSWGEDGYMFMPYGCSKIGYATTIVDYGQQGIYFWADTTVGWVPLEANFESFSPLEIDSWSWDFGDGEYSYDELPSHTYTTNGAFDVSLEVNTGGDIRSITKEKYIIAIADTVRGDTVSTLPDTKIMVTVTANNSAPTRYLKIPFEFANAFAMTFDSFSTVGCRTDYFEVQDYLHWDLNSGKRATLRLQASALDTSPDLEPGEGPIVKLYFTVPGTAPLGASALIELDGYLSYLPAYYGDYANYEIASINGRVIIGGTCCINSGDADHDGSVDMLDIDYFINWLLRDGPELPCLEEGDVDGNESTNILDIDRMISYFFMSGDPFEPCQ